MTRIENGLSILNSLAEAYEGPCLFLYAAIAGLVLLAVFGGRKSRALLLYPCVILMCTVFNPLILDAFYSGAENEADFHIVFFWAVPVVLIIAASAVAPGSALTNPFLRVLPAGLVIVLAIITGVPGISAYENVSLPSNLLKADPQLVSLIGFMDKKSTSDTYSAAFENRALCYGAEEYSAEIVISDLFLNDSDTENEEAFQEAVSEYAPDFYVVTRGGTAEKLLKGMELTELAHTDAYSVYSAGMG